MSFSEVYEKFGGDGNLVGSTDHWVVLARPKQVTIGSCVLMARQDALSMSELSEDALRDLGRASGQLEDALAAVVGADKVNYLLLMMKDPQLHFHVIPRHEGSRELFGGVWEDANWPKPPVMSESVTDDTRVIEELRIALGREFDKA
jgi:diadenosine tetraphosphate (Ap4A) HIT family hydrolase